MPIKWNKVTWYSKAIALAIVVVLPFIGLAIGVREGGALGALQEDVRLSGLPASHADGSAADAYYAQPASWQADRRDDAKFGIAYPLDFESNDIMNGTLSTDWRVNAGDAQGVKLFSLTIPKAVEPQTNFSEATLTVGGSEDPKAVSGCLVPDAGQQVGQPITETINGISFIVFKTADAGAGNFYETTSYRTVRNSQCIAVEYTIHSTQIANYPDSYKLHPFNELRIDGILKRIVGTFTLL